VTLKYPLSYFKSDEIYGKNNWKLPYNYNHYYVEGVLKKELLFEGNHSGYALEVGELNGERFVVTKASLLKYEKFNFNNFYKLTFQVASNNKIFKHFDRVIAPKDYEFMQNNNNEEEYPAERDRQDSPSPADRDRQDTHPGIGGIHRKNQ
jgi:hypothetical protein